MTPTGSKSCAAGLASLELLSLTNRSLFIFSVSPTDIVHNFPVRIVLHAFLCLRFLPLMFWVLVACLGAARADTAVSGAITANTVWATAGSPYVLNGDVTISNQALLTLEAGTQVRMGPGANLIVDHGAIRAIGRSDLPVVITSVKEGGASSPAPGDWGRIIFRDGTDDAATRLDWVRVRFGLGLKIEAASPTLNNVAIDYQAGPALEIDLASSPVGSGLSAEGNSINGILTPAGEVSGELKWGLRGIPYVVASGELSIGAKPRLVSVAPSTIEQGSATLVTLSGVRLQGLSNVGFDKPGLDASVQPGITATQAQMLVTAGVNVPIGLASITAMTDAGEIRLANAITVKRKEPKLVSVSPASVYTRQAAQTLDITGQDISPSSAVELDGVPLVTQYLSATHLQAILPTQTAAASRVLRLRTPDPDAPDVPMFSNALTVVVQVPPLVSLKGATEYGAPANAVTEFTINQPAVTAVGDYLLLLVYRRVAVGVPAGYTLLAEVANNSAYQWVSVYGKSADVAGAAAQRITLASASPRVGASILTLRASGATPVLYGPWKQLIPGQASAHSVPAATSPVAGLAVAVNHEGFALIDGTTSFYANSPYIPARVGTAVQNRFAVATRNVSQGTALAGSVTTCCNSDGGDMVFVLGW